MNREYKIYKITYFLMAVNVITYLYTSLKYGLSMSAMQGIQVGGFNPLYVYYYHEYYRMITANFIHFGLMHIFCNVYSLYNLGMLMEKILKEKKYIIVIVVSMISTTLFSYLLFLLFKYIDYKLLDISSQTFIASMIELLNPSSSNVRTASIVVPAGEQTISFNSPGCFPVSRTIFALPRTACAAN